MNCYQIISYSRLAQLGSSPDFIKTAVSLAQLRDVVQKHFYDKKMYYLQKVYVCYESARSKIDTVAINDITLAGLGDDRPTPPAAGFGVATTIANTLRRRFRFSRPTPYHPIER